MESHLRHVLSPILWLDKVCGGSRLHNRLTKGQRQHLRTLRQHLRGPEKTMHHLEQGLFVGVAVLGALAALVLKPVIVSTALRIAVLAAVCLVVLQLCKASVDKLHDYKTSQHHPALLRGLAHVVQIVPAVVGLTLQGLGWLSVQCTPDCLLHPALSTQLQDLKSINNFDILLSGVMALPASMYVMGAHALHRITGQTEWKHQADRWTLQITGGAHSSPELLGRTLRQATQALIQEAQAQCQSLFRQQNPEMPGM